MDERTRHAIDQDELRKAGPLPPRSWRLAARRAWHGFVRHRGLDAAAALTFFTTLAAFPAALAFTSAFALTSDRQRAVDDIVAIAGTLLPDDVAEQLATPIDQLLRLDNPGIALTIALVLLLWTTSGYATAFGRAINAVYGVQEGRLFWMFRAKMLLVAAVLVLVASAIVASLLATPDTVQQVLGDRGLGPIATLVWSIVRWPLLVALAFVFIAVLYTTTPNVRHPKAVWASVGSGFAVAVWAIGTAGYAGYVLLVGAYGAIYGSIGTLLVALLWGYLTNIALVAGVELDAEFVRLRQLARGIEAEEIVRMPVRDVRRDHWIARQHDDDVARSRRIREESGG
ncbi:YihY/virulence factor BrkB family protein [Homoserinibacter sp. GY 40078]|uniref:YihY/virulence factor BrkB family protein n=1 Tax=Homoserinibacter sp. GY 40078 TaxID=2603275 RepID=UPI0011CBA338|nr:YihY/virulence factor BrkB family protein [Homoserinibacter sp. GY 40078]TXK17348.1 YihY/virulence factor BrkB family protein [Homoserinibacter sp. GY 40078]